MKRKYFLHKFIRYFLLFSLPILFMGIMLCVYCSVKIKNDINLQAQSTFHTGTRLMEEIMQTGDDTAAMFNNNSTVSLSLYKILNRNSLNYKEYVVRSVVFSILENAKSNNSLVESIYIYLDNDQGNYFQTDKKTVALSDSPDQEWLDIFNKTDISIQKWVVRREIKNYEFESSHECVSIFRRIKNYRGVLVINLNAASLSRLLSSIENYANEAVLVADGDGQVLFSNQIASSLSPASGMDIIEQLDIDGSSEDDFLSTVRLQGRQFIMTKFYSSGYGLYFLSLVPVKDIYQLLYQIIFSVLLGIMMAAVFCLIFSFYLTNKNFRQIENLIEILSAAEAGTYTSALPGYCYENARKLDEYNLILNQVIHTYVRNNTLTLELKEAELRKTLLELRSLQLQINPHFFFNTLQSIDMEILKKEGYGSPASQLIESLSGILRYALEDSSSPVALREEIQSCKDYFAIQQFHYPGRIALLWDYEDSVLEYSVLRLLFQPLVENSIHYGILTRNDTCVIRIKIFLRNGHLNFHVLDTGAGMSKEKLTDLRQSLHSQSLHSPEGQRRSIGIKNTHKRLILSYPGSEGLTIISREEKGTCVSFSIPV